MLRRNDKAFRVPESEADIWIQIHGIDSLLRNASAPQEYGMLELHRTKLRQNLSQRARSMIEFPEYAERITKILKYPGMRSDFRGPLFESFLRGRTIEVQPSQTN
jgi:hypothetical protein